MLLTERTTPVRLTEMFLRYFGLICLLLFLSLLFVLLDTIVKFRLHILSFRFRSLSSICGTALNHRQQISLVSAEVVLVSPVSQVVLEVLCVFVFCKRLFLESQSLIIDYYSLCLCLEPIRTEGLPPGPQCCRDLCVCVICSFIFLLIALGRWQLSVWFIEVLHQWESNLAVSTTHLSLSSLSLPLLGK